MRVACNLPTPKDKAKRPEETCNSNVSAAPDGSSLVAAEASQPVCVESRACRVEIIEERSVPAGIATIGRGGICTP